MDTKNLISIEEHDARVHAREDNAYLTGIECPSCGKELQYQDNIAYLSSPPQKDVLCYNCGHKSRVFV